MPGPGRYIVVVTNDSEPSTNPAIQTHWVGATSATQEMVAAQLVAFTQYQLCGAGSRIARIEYSTAPTGGTLPIEFPDVAYGLLSFADPALVPMTDFNVSFGTGPLAVLGSGGVFSKRTTTPGRTGRGRLTTPWLRQAEVTAAGRLGAASVTAMLDGWNCYIRRIDIGTRSSTIADLFPYVNSSTGDHLVTNVTMTTRLGRLRSRTR